MAEEGSCLPHANHTCAKRALQGTPHTFSHKAEEQELFCAVGLRGSLCSVSAWFFLQLSQTLTFAFLSPSGSWCGCRWPLFLHIIVANIQLHLHPCWLQQETEELNSTKPA